ncbi:MAG: SufE family protein [Chitinophagales bacterium]|jgi:cysteine desulfuration protein SufE|nr:SufE family protein [Chitinophagales bacterium]
MNWNEAENNLIEAFEWISDELERYEVILDYAKQVKPISDELKTDDRIVKGCQSKIWVEVLRQSQNFEILGDSNTAITKGLLGIVTSLLMSRPIEEAKVYDFKIFEAVGLHKFLTSQRSNGLKSLILTIQEKL